LWQIVAKAVANGTEMVPATKAFSLPSPRPLAIHAVDARPTIDQCAQVVGDKRGLEVEMNFASSVHCLAGRTITG